MKPFVLKNSYAEAFEAWDQFHIYFQKEKGRLKFETL